MLEAKFKVGQQVYAVSNKSDSRQIHVKCDVCNSTGKVKVEGRDEEYVCPACHGRTETEHYGYMYVISYYEATIGKIEIEEYAPKYKDFYEKHGYLPKYFDVYNGLEVKDYAPTISTRSNGAMGSGTLLVICENNE